MPIRRRIVPWANPSTKKRPKNPMINRSIVSNPRMKSPISTRTPCASRPHRWRGGRKGSSGHPALARPCPVDGRFGRSGAVLGGPASRPLRPGDGPPTSVARPAVIDSTACRDLRLGQGPVLAGEDEPEGQADLVVGRAAAPVAVEQGDGAQQRTHRADGWPPRPRSRSVGRPRRPPGRARRPGGATAWLTLASTSRPPARPATASSPTTIRSARRSSASRTRRMQLADPPDQRRRPTGSAPPDPGCRFGSSASGRRIRRLQGGRDGPR